MKGHFKLARQAAGRGAFAEVRVEISMASPAQEAAAKITYAPAASDALSPSDPFVAAAVSGIEKILSSACLTAGEQTIAEIRVVEIVVNWVDTTPDAVEAAAQLAVINAVGADERFDLTHDEKWKVSAC
ncbi:hypothetical protein ACEWPM_007525 [Roseovarius sp. S4756]|uniref:hypothetical protein n=1 Tax=Roseovarius maritimus TaxID=3342637 RepID=UPI00372CE5B0